MSLVTQGFGAKTGIVTQGLGFSPFVIIRVYEKTANTIRKRFKTQIEDTLTLPTHYDNAPFNIPADSEWARLTIQFGRARQVDIGTGAKKFRIPGIAMVQIFDNIRKGDQNILSIASSVSLAFRTVVVLNVVFKNPSIKTVGMRDGKYWQVNVECPFFVDTLD